MNAREFLDCDGDTWTEFEPGQLRLTKRANGSPVTNDCECSIEDARDDHGPLTEICADVGVRALLAGVLEELAEDVRKEYWRSEDPISERIYERLGDVLSCKARELREESAND